MLSLHFTLDITQGVGITNLAGLQLSSLNLISFQK